MKDKKEILKQILKDTGKGVRGYFKAQLTLMIITFLTLAIGLNIIDIRFNILIALGIALVDMLPVFGSGIIMVPWAIISFISGNNELGKSLAILYVILLVSRQFIEPYILGRSIGVKPLYTFLASIIGSIAFGPVGIIIGPLIAVVITSIFKARNNYENRR